MKCTLRTFGETTNVRYYVNEALLINVVPTSTKKSSIEDAHKDPLDKSNSATALTENADGVVTYHEP